MVEAEQERTFPVASLTKEDLLYCVPELEAHIVALTDTDMARIADRLSDALQESYQLALSTILEGYLPIMEPSGDVDEDLV